MKKLNELPFTELIALRNHFNNCRAELLSGGEVIMGFEKEYSDYSIKTETIDDYISKMYDAHLFVSEPLDDIETLKNKKKHVDKELEDFSKSIRRG